MSSDRKRWLKIRAEPTAGPQMTQALTKIKCINIHRWTTILENYARSLLFFVHGILRAVGGSDVFIWFQTEEQFDGASTISNWCLKKVNNIGHIVVKCSNWTKKWWCMPAKNYEWFIKINSHQRFESFFSPFFSMAIYFTKHRKMWYDLTQGQRKKSHRFVNQIGQIVFVWRFTSGKVELQKVQSHHL